MEAVEAKPEFAIFSAGASTSKEWAPVFAKNGTVVIDNSSYWRMDKNIPLVVPEINSHVIKKGDRIIANPNCSTIQMVMALAPLHRKYKIKRLVVATYQSVTGTGVKAVAQMENERAGSKERWHMRIQSIRTVSLMEDTFQPDGYTTEEQKLIDETRKILEDQTIQVTATVVRIPVVGGHSEAVNIEFEKDFDIEDVRLVLLASFPGVVVYDNPAENKYPMPIMLITGMRFLLEGSEEIFQRKNVLISGLYRIISEKAPPQMQFRLQSIWQQINYIKPPPS